MKYSHVRATLFVLDDLADAEATFFLTWIKHDDDIDAFFKVVNNRVSNLREVIFKHGGEVCSATPGRTTYLSIERDLHFVQFFRFTTRWIVIELTWKILTNSACERFS